MDGPKPSEIYHMHSKESIQAVLKTDGWKIVAFRPPIHGDLFLTYWPRLEVQTAYINFTAFPADNGGHYRLILAPKKKGAS